MGGPNPTGAAAHARGGPGSRGGTGPKPRRFQVRSNADTLQEYDSATNPTEVMGGRSSAAAIIQIMEGSSAADFAIQTAVRGEAQLHPLLIQRLVDFDFYGRKSLVQQRHSLMKANVFAVADHPVMEGDRGTFWETQSVVGRLRPLKATRDPGAGRVNFKVLDWLTDVGLFK